MHLLVFDFDGVLADTFADMIRFAQEMCDELGVRHTVVQVDLSDLEVMSFATFGRACGVPEHLVGEFVRGCTGKFARKKTPPAIFDGLADVIRKLAEETSLVIVTGNTSENVKVFLTHHGLQDCFRRVYGVDMPGSKAGKIGMAGSEFGAMNESTFLIGDSLSDIRAAREAGVKSVAVAWGHQRLDMLVEGKPDGVVHSPAELLDILRPGK